MTARRYFPLLAFAALMLVTADAMATDLQGRESTFDPSLLRIDEPKYLGSPLDGRTPMIDAEGRSLTLYDSLGKPLILLLSYYGCSGSCPTMNANLAQVLRQVQRFQLGRDYRVLTVSFDPHDTPQSAAAFLDRIQAVPADMRAGWRHVVLRGPAQQVRDFADRVGFHYFWSREDKVFLHPNVLVFLTPQGRVARYLYGTRVDAPTVELALIDADWGRISNSTAIFDMLTGACYSYNFAEGRYQPNYSLLAGVGSLMLGVGSMASGAWLYRRKRKREARHE